MHNRGFGSSEAIQRQHVAKLYRVFPSLAFSEVAFVYGSDFITDDVRSKLTLDIDCMKGSPLYKSVT
jgi:hypothetical protein